jgi:hypothetical protein
MYFSLDVQREADLRIFEKTGEGVRGGRDKRACEG